MKTIQLAQWVYGRVATGESGSPGYQVAAASNSVAQNRKLADRLVELSQYSQSPDATHVRWGYADTGLGWVTFWRCAFARDMSGKIGYFTHHRLARVDDVVALGHVPVEVLWTEPYFTREAELPEDRTLPELELTIEETDSSGPPSNEALRLADSLIRRDKNTAVPALLTGDRSDEAVARIAAETLPLLPPPIALATAFCINHTRSRDALVRFSFITSPAEELLATPQALFRVIDPAVEVELRSPLIKAIHGRVVDVHTFQEYARAVYSWNRKGPSASVAACEATPHPFPEWLEHDWPAWNRDYLDAHPAVYAAYYTRCPTWSPEALRPLLARSPVTWAKAFEPFPSRRDIRTAIVEELAKRLAEVTSEETRGDEALENVLDWLGRNGLLDEVSALGMGWPLDHAASLADRLATHAEYDARLHLRIASRLLTSPDMGVWASWFDWLEANEDRCGTTGQLIRGLLAVREDRPGATLPNPERMGEADYQHTLHAVAQLVAHDLRDPHVIQTLIADTLCQHYQTAGLRFLERLLDSPASRLAIRAAESVRFLDEAARSALIERLEQAPHARETANEWLALDHDANGSILTSEQRQRLESLVSRGGRLGGFLNWLLGKG